VESLPDHRVGCFLHGRSTLTLADEFEGQYTSGPKCSTRESKTGFGCCIRIDCRWFVRRRGHRRLLLQKTEFSKAITTDEYFKERN